MMRRSSSQERVATMLTSQTSESVPIGRNSRRGESSTTVRFCFVPNQKPQCVCEFHAISSSRSLSFQVAATSPAIVRAHPQQQASCRRDSANKARILAAIFANRLYLKYKARGSIAHEVQRRPPAEPYSRSRNARPA